MTVSRQYNQSSPSFNMPTLRHFMNRQAWHDLRLLLVISHSLVAGQLYSIFPEEDDEKYVVIKSVSSQGARHKLIFEIIPKQGDEIRNGTQKGAQKHSKRHNICTPCPKVTLQ